MTLHLLPNLLAEGLDPKSAFVPVLYDIIPTLDGIIGESERNARRYLKLFRDDFRDVPIELLNEHNKDVRPLLKPLEKGESWGLISDCGLPLLADPGAKLVAGARAKKIDVQVYPGPSSIIQALMLSGFSAQGFTFHGYLPRDPTRREQALKALVTSMRKTRLTQVFIEAPYRNNPMRNDLIRLIPKEIGIIAAVDLMLPSQAIFDVRTNPELHKKCVVFVLGF
ncbi:MAG: SAM-dependent methyltransferase [Chlamydiales bacterium]|nr:SAM-dependent methyltransferase [Chlamydiales bacterium]